MHLLVLFVGQLLCYDGDARCKPTVTPLQVWEKREREGASGRDCILPVLFMGLSIPAKQKGRWEDTLETETAPREMLIPALVRSS